MRDRLILVDADDREVGTESKLPAHVDGKLHRAFSVFVFDGAGRMLLQRRAAQKYHSAGLWSNTCCGHPLSGEPTEEAAHRRLGEEMGFDCPLQPVFRFRYRAEVDNGLVEHEYDHVLVGRFDGSPVPNPEEVAEWRWAAFEDVSEDHVVNPTTYSVWFKIALREFQVRGWSTSRAASSPW